ncbi:MAG: hypothetical protein ACP6IS_07445 [Candidatus Asgardarchaeia archaeon]
MDFLILVFTAFGGIIVTLSSLYAYKLYKIPKIIRLLDKAIFRTVKNEFVDFSKFPKIEETFKELIMVLYKPVLKKKTIITNLERLSNLKEKVI